MTPESPTAQSGPSEAVAKLEEIRDGIWLACNNAAQCDFIKSEIDGVIAAIQTPPAGARDAVCDYGSLAHRLYCAIACNGDSACIFGADPVVRERWLSGVEEVLGKATQPAAPRTRHPLAHRERMCERVSTNPEPQPAATGAGECSHSWRDYVQAEYKASPAITLGESNIARYVKIGRMCEECGKVETNTAASVPVDELILQAVARGWCAPENAKKVVDPDLAVAITREVQAALATQPAPDTRRAPVQKYHDKTIPWRVHGLAWEAYAKEYGTSQSAERLAERGGFGIGEMDRFLPGWRDMAHAIDFPAQPAPVVGGESMLELAAYLRTWGTSAEQTECGDTGDESVFVPRCISGEFHDCLHDAAKIIERLAARPGGEGENHKLDTDSQVFFYEQDFYVLSNFSSFSLQWDGWRFDTSEAAYHYEKFKFHAPDICDLVRTAPSAHEAFKVAERNKHLRNPDWDNVKIPVMRAILRAKADQHEYVRRKLLATGTRILVEDSWRDDYWGWGPNRDGQNMLGKLWMEVRESIAHLAQAGGEVES